MFVENQPSRPRSLALIPGARIEVEAVAPERPGDVVVAGLDEHADVVGGARQPVEPRARRPEVLRRAEVGAHVDGAQGVAAVEVAAS